MHCRTVRLGLGIFLGLGILGLGARFLHAHEDSLSLPIPLRRILLPPERLPAELKRVKEGVLLRMPRADFELLVQRASRAYRASKNPPRLIEARYRATWREDSGLVGTAQWKLLHRGPGPDLLPLGAEASSGFNLAIKQPRFENREALLTEFPDASGEAKAQGLALYVDRPGEHTLTFEWSARADPRPEGLLVDLRLPECPAGSLELELPADRRVSLVGGGSLSGPHPAQDSQQRLWYLATGGKTQFSLLLHRTGQDRSAPVVLAWQKMIQRLSPDGLEVNSAFTLEAMHQEVTELSLLLDPRLRPVEVQAPGLRQWKILSADSLRPVELLLQFHQPFREGMLEVRCLAPLSSPLPAHASADSPTTFHWSSPSIQLRQAVSRGETLELHLHPEVRLLSWEAGDFRLLDSSIVPDPDKKLPHRRLVLLGGGISSRTNGSTPPRDPRRPGGILQTAGVEFRARQQSWWRLEERGTELLCQLEYEVRQGQLFQFPLRLPQGWEVDTVELTPSEMLRSWGVKPDKTGPILLVDLRRPLRAGTGEGNATLQIRLRRTGQFSSRALSFPDVVPLGARYREGGLALDFDQQLYQAQLNTSFVNEEPPLTGPWGKSLPDFYYPFRGENPAGSIQLLPRQPRARAQLDSQLVLLRGQALLRTRLLLEAESGAATHVDVHVSAGGEKPWDWQSLSPSASDSSSPGPVRAQRLLSVEVASALAPLASPPLQTAVLSAARPPGTIWRLWLAPPLEARQTITLQTTRTLQPQPGAIPGLEHWNIPLIGVPQASHQDGEITVFRPDVEVLGIRQQSTHEGPPRKLRHWDHRGAPWRTFRYHDVQAQLSLQTRTLPPGRLAEAVLDRARLVNLLIPGAESRHYFRLHLSRWPHRQLPIKLPQDARLLALAIAGRWLETPPAVDATNTLPVPIPARGNSCLIEILYTSPSLAKGVWQRLPAPKPELPMPVTSFENCWLLPPDLIPLGDGKARALPGTGATPRSASARLTRLLRLGPALPFVSRPDERLQLRQQTLLDACAEFCSERGGMEETLASLIEQLAWEYLREAFPLVIDRLALERAAVQPFSLMRVSTEPAHPLGKDLTEVVAPWEDRKVLLLATPSAVLLTTPAQVRSSLQSSVRGEIETALKTALENGQDPTGRYLTALEWLARDQATRPQEHSLLLGEGEMEGWIEWMPIAGHDSTEELLVVDRPSISLFGVGLGSLLTLVWVLFRHASAPTRTLFLLGWLAFTGLALAWLPLAILELAWWPLLFGLAISLPWYLLWVWQRLPAAKTSRSTMIREPPLSLGSSLSGMVLVALLAAGFTWAQSSSTPSPSKAENVFLLTGEPQEVLVRPALVQHLQKLVRPAEFLTRAAVLVSANYDGKMLKDRAEFRVLYQAQTLTEEPVELEIPLGDVQLIGEVLVNGARAYPVVLPAPKTGYALRLKGQGKHQIEMRFQVPVQQEPNNPYAKQIRFRAPSLVQNRVQFQAPPGSSFLRIPVKHGLQRVFSERESPRVEAEVGAVNSPLSLRWEERAPATVRPRIEFQEAYLWDLRPDASLLTAQLHYSISGSAVSSLTVHVPPELAVRSARARRAVADKPLTGEVKSPREPLRLRDWDVQGQGEQRAVHLQFPFPIIGPVEITLELVPTTVWASSVLLPLPRPQGVPVPGTSSYLAYRQQGLEVTRTNWLRLGGIRPNQFAPFWPTATKPDPATLDYASSFTHDPKLAPELRLLLRPASPRTQVLQTLTFQIGRTQAELSAQLELKTARKELSLLEWEILSPQTLTIASVSGPEVTRWSQFGNRLLVWLERTTEATKLELTGWLALYPEPSKQAGTPPVSRFDLPCLRLEHSGQTSTTLILRPQPGWTLAELGVKQLVPQKPSLVGERRLLGKEPTYSGSYLLRQGPTTTAHVVTTLKREAKDLTFLSVIDYKMAGDPRALNLQLRNWDGEASLDAPAGLIVKSIEPATRSSGRRERSWSLQLRPGLAEQHRLSIRGKIPLEQLAASVVFPEILVQGAQTTHRLIVEPTLRIERSSGLDTRSPPPESPQGTLAFVPLSREWVLRLSLPESSPATPVRVLLGESRLSVPDGQSWLHEIRFWLQHETATELMVEWPAQIDILSAHLDATPMDLREPQGNRSTLPLPGGPAIRELIVRYRYRPGVESLSNPELTPPRLLGLAPGPLVWTVEVPPGWEVTRSLGGHRLGAGPTRRALLELHRASRLIAQLHLHQQLPSTEKSEFQNRALRACWLADLALQAGADARLPLGPQGQTLPDWLAALRKELRTEIEPAFPEETGPESSPPQDQASLSWDHDPARGTPLSWLQDRPDRVPTVRLSPTTAREVRRAFAFSGQWLVLLLAVWTVSLSIVLRTLVRWLWPEQFLLLGILCWSLLGPTLLVLCLLTLGVVGRLVLLFQALQSLLQRWTHQSISPSSSP